MNPQKLFNYLLQNLETSMNVCILWDIIKVLRGKKTKLVLYTYDSFLFDWDEEGTDELMEDIKDIFKKYKFNIKVKQGYDYDFRYDNQIRITRIMMLLHHYKILGDLNNKLFCTFTILKSLR